jgi:hypothetical protein
MKESVGRLLQGVPVSDVISGLLTEVIAHTPVAVSMLLFDRSVDGLDMEDLSD